MKIERHLCDLCGATIRKGELFATLSVPNFDEPSRKTKKVSEDMYLSFMLSLGPTVSVGKSYEVCRGCVDGLLRARAAIKRAALERAYADAEVEVQ